MWRTAIWIQICRRKISTTLPLQSFHTTPTRIPQFIVTSPCTLLWANSKLTAKLQRPCRNDCFSYWKQGSISFSDQFLFGWFNLESSIDLLNLYDGLSIILISVAVHNISDPMYLPKFKSNLNLFYEGHFMGFWDALWHLICISYYFSQFFQQFHIKYVGNPASF